jgi:hypothetical protein
LFRLSELVTCLNAWFGSCFESTGAMYFLWLIIEGRSFKLHQEVGLILRKLVGDDKFNEMFIPRFTPYIIGKYRLTDVVKILLVMVHFTSDLFIYCRVFCVAWCKVVLLSCLLPCQCGQTLRGRTHL